MVFIHLFLCLPWLQCPFTSASRMRVRNDLCCVGWGVKLYSIQSNQGCAWCIGHHLTTGGVHIISILSHISPAFTTME